MKVVLFGFMCCLVLAGCSSPPTTTQTPVSPTPVEAKKVTSVGVVHATPKPVLISNGAGELIVTLKVDGGYHVNANPPTYPYLKATELVITPSEGLSASAVKYPAALTRKFPFAEKPLAVYEGDTEIRATIKADTNARPGEHSIAAVLRVQACDEQVCYPPGHIDLQLPVVVK